MRKNAFLSKYKDQPPIISFSQTLHTCPLSFCFPFPKKNKNTLSWDLTHSIGWCGAFPPGPSPASLPRRLRWRGTRAHRLPGPSRSDDPPRVDRSEFLGMTSQLLDWVSWACQVYQNSNFRDFHLILFFHPFELLLFFHTSPSHKNINIPKPLHLQHLLSPLPPDASTRDPHPSAHVQRWWSERPGATAALRSPPCGAFKGVGVASGLCWVAVLFEVGLFWVKKGGAVVFFPLCFVVLFWSEGITVVIFAVSWALRGFCFRIRFLGLKQRKKKHFGWET